MKKLEAAEHWFLRKMLRIPWTDKFSTCEVLCRAGEGKELMQDMIHRQMMMMIYIMIGIIIACSYLKEDWHG